MGNVSNRKVISRDYVGVGGHGCGGLLVWVTAGTGFFHRQLQEGTHGARVASSAAH